MSMNVAMHWSSTSRTGVRARRAARAAADLLGGRARGRAGGAVGSLMPRPPTSRAPRAAERRVCSTSSACIARTSPSAAEAGDLVHRPVALARASRGTRGQERRRAPGAREQGPTTPAGARWPRVVGRSTSAVEVDEASLQSVALGAPDVFLDEPAPVGRQRVSRVVGRRRRWRCTPASGRRRRAPGACRSARRRSAPRPCRRCGAGARSTRSGCSPRSSRCAPAAPRSARSRPSPRRRPGRRSAGSSW